MKHLKKLEEDENAAAVPAPVTGKQQYNFKEKVKSELKAIQHAISIIENGESFDEDYVKEQYIKLGIYGRLVNTLNTMDDFDKVYKHYQFVIGSMKDKMEFIEIESK